MSGLYAPIGRRHRLATSALVGAIGLFLSTAAPHAETISSAPGGVLVAPLIMAGNPDRDCL